VIGSHARICLDPVKNVFVPQYSRTKVGDVLEQMLRLKWCAWWTCMLNLCEALKCHEWPHSGLHQSFTNDGF